MAATDSPLSLLTAATGLPGPSVPSSIAQSQGPVVSGATQSGISLSTGSFSVGGGISNTVMIVAAIAAAVYFIMRK